ncbi:MAG: Holliday junction resolvase RuvX, partial [Blastocatellia bacterium]|nr:Holliday junction resolvase RuvX [Blastocatellia bacterium]
TIDRSPTAKSFKAIADLVSEMEVEKVVVGLPIRLDGTRGDAVLRVEKFIERLQQFISCPIVGWDEKLTSYEAEERMRQAGLKAHERKKRIDEFAAVVILEDYIHLSNSKL